MLQRLTQSLAFSLASLYVAGLQYTNYTVQSLTTVSGYTLQDQASNLVQSIGICLINSV